jgi:hypothetical protein
MRKILLLLAIVLMLPAFGAQAAERWTPEKARGWYAQQKWLVGTNYLPSTAINQLEMWQADSFDAKRIDQEFAWAAAMGMNTQRVFLHDLLWQQDAAGFKRRIGQFLDIAARHGIKPMFVLFDSCWDPNPKLGPQHPPIPGVHNSGWVQGPGAAAMSDRSQHARLEAYVKDIVASFAHDNRILAWDVWNEPDNFAGQYPDDTKVKIANVTELLPKVFDWARSANPSQPLTSGVWHNPDWNALERLNPIERTQITQSDIISFHDYGWPERFEARVKELQVYGRPILCTEYMARGNGSTIDTILPLGKKLDVAMINWGFVDGKSQTRFPWDSWQKPYTQSPPTVWFHEILRNDGTPYREREVAIIKAMSAAPRGQAPLP